jgi:hypothetical protein
MKKVNDLIGIYKEMSPEKLQDEIDCVFEIIQAILEATESDSIEMFLDPSCKLKFSCEVIKNESRYYC